MGISSFGREVKARKALIEEQRGIPRKEAATLNDLFNDWHKKENWHKNMALYKAFMKNIGDIQELMVDALRKQRIVQ
jgi:hypothetical protein